MTKLPEHWLNELREKQVHRHQVTMTHAQAHELEEELRKLRKELRRKEFMVENGLGEEDMKDDITYP